MKTYALQPTDPAAVKIGRAAYPDYTGRKFELAIHDKGGMKLTSYWDGGSRNYYTVVKLEDFTTLEVPQNGTPFDGYGYGIDAPLPAPGIAVIEHSIFCGKDSGLTIHIHAENAAPLLPARAELTWEEKVVLVATKSLKSSYAGIPEYRFHEAHEDAGITRAAWDAAKAGLIARKLLNAAGAITVDGRNASSGCGDLWSVAREREDSPVSRRFRQIREAQDAAAGSQLQEAQS